MTLIEVIVAISIMGIVATAATGLAIASTTGSVTQQHQAVAVTVANDAMEQVSGLPAGLIYSGRSASDVTASFVANSSIPAVANTYQEYDHSLPLPSAQKVPINDTQTQDGTVYKITTVIGTCFQKLGTMPGQTAGGDCTKLPSSQTLPTSFPGYTPLTRVVVLVRWTGGQGCSTASPCSYAVTTLLDAHADLEWTTNG
ncbi:prepilin-type N-terminal cleavage/methylation domain-containing protein [Lacisediminihabitans sp. G11-30]|uniref:Prepilin-type N-terminal cleavage/methylation domain-containing protein n=2 Tax=Lacisediminihabitans changchengi TaxID=2787634 RepID=A0A934SUS3_9MICO|nr:prepilin-type N-terminal cleavage/methylation domain-containing protein [Lacisediminihabitans changchengi]MBK4348419.1 prepilin-type N-terminal cleavage/methylation domain-containing protein [Lacisediminihabitans changchengi]